MATPDVHGPIDFVIIEFPAGTSGKATANALVDLVDRGVIRLYDLMVVHKDPNGAFEELDIRTRSHDDLGALARFAGARSGLLGPDDVTEAANALGPGTTAAVLLYENAWAVPFVAAARREGAQLVASSRLSAQQIMDTLDAVEART